MRVFLDTWVLVEKYKENNYAERVLEAAKTLFETHISVITMAELVNVIDRLYGDKEARIQFAYINSVPLIQNPLTLGVAFKAGLLKTKYRFSLADAVILSTAIATESDVLVTGGEKQYEKEWKNVNELKVAKLNEFVENHCP